MARSIAQDTVNGWEWFAYSYKVLEVIFQPVFRLLVACFSEQKSNKEIRANEGSCWLS